VVWQVSGQVVEGRDESLEEIGQRAPLVRVELAQHPCEGRASAVQHRVVSLAP
jgi:hypothetical protein